MDRSPTDPVPGVQRREELAERVICVVARDVLALNRQEPGASELARSLWGGRWLILGCVLGFGLLATVYALLTTPWYTAQVVLTPQASKNTQGLSSQFEGLGVLAGLASLGLGGSRTAEPIGVLESRDFARQFIEEHGLLHVFLEDKWDARRGRWKEPDPNRQPDIRDAIDYFKKQILLVTEDKKSGLVTVSIRWKNAALASSWANEIVERLNDQMRARALTEGEANVAYLQKELAATNVVPVQQAVSKLLEQELQKVMVARGQQQFAFRVVDHADVPKWRSWPKRRLIVALGVLAGALAGLGLVFARGLLAHRSPSAAD